MKKIIRTTVVLFLLLAAAQGRGATVHWFEAEDFKGNAEIQKDTSASGGQCVGGRTWYVFARNLPAPPLKDHEKLHLWARIKSDVPANWYLMRADKKAFGWFRSDRDEWQWVRIGTFSGKSLAADKNIFPEIYLQRPVKQDVPTANGWMDALVFTDIDDPSLLDDLLKSKKTAPAENTPADRALLEQLKNLRRAVECPVFSSAPVIDGRLDDAAWREAALLDRFMTIGGAKMAGQQTVVRIGRDREYLYIGAELKESKIPFIRKIRTEKNDRVWTDDCLEIFIDPGLTQKNPFQLTVNALGTRQDNLARRIDEAGFIARNLDWEAAAAIGGESWFVEARIPWKLLSDRLPGDGTAWGFNACRNQSPDNEQSYWNNTGEYFSRAENYGLLMFCKLPAVFSGLAFDAMSDKLQYRFANGDRTVAVSAALEFAGKTVMEKQEGLRDSGEPVHADMNIHGGKPGTYRLRTVIKHHDVPAVSFSLDLKTYSKGIASSAWPPDERGNILPILGGTVQQCFFVAGNHGQKVLPRPNLKVWVPDGISILDPVPDMKPAFYFQVGRPEITAVEKDGRKYHEYNFKFEKDLAPRQLSVQPFHQSVLLYFKVDDPGLEGRTENVYYQLSSGAEVEEEQVMELKILPAFKGKQPRHYVIHNWLWTIAPSPGNWSEAVRTQALVGFNSLEAGYVASREDYTKVIRDNRFTIYNNIWWHWQNQAYLERHPGHIAVNYKGGKDKAGGICPSVLLADDGKVLRASHAERLDHIRAGRVDGLIWDLEGPYCWDICFCPRCIKEFIEWAGIDAADLKPSDIRNRYAGKWIEFCCRQSSEMCRIMQREVKKIKPDGKWGFYSATPGFSTMETYRVNWKEAGPYLDLALPSYYAASDSVLDGTFNADMAKVIKELRSSSPQPMQVWATLTAGYGRNGSISPSAELVKMQVLRSIASGMDGVTFWWWGPFDGWYYRKMAEATRLIADFEDFFRQGEKPDSGRVIHSYGNRISSFATRKDGINFMVIFNHNSQSAGTVAVKLPSAMVSHRYPDGERLSGAAEFRVEVPALEVAVIVSSKDDRALRHILNCRD